MTLATLIVCQAIAGYAIRRTIRPSDSLLETFVMALALGTAVASLAGLVTSTLGIGPWGALIWASARLLLAKDDKPELPSDISRKVLPRVDAMLLGQPLIRNS